jgi:hypothetical protein
VTTLLFSVRSDCEQPADHFSRIGVTLTPVRDLPHSRQHDFNRDVINPQDGHMVCDPYLAIRGVKLCILRNSRIVNSTTSRPREKLVAFMKSDPSWRVLHQTAWQTTKVGQLQMDWLRSEDLKEEKNVTFPLTTIAVHAEGVPFGHDRNTSACPESHSLEQWVAANVVVLRQEPDDEEDEEEDEGNPKEDDDDDDDDGEDGYSE